MSGASNRILVIAFALALAACAGPSPSATAPPVASPTPTVSPPPSPTIGAPSGVASAAQAAALVLASDPHFGSVRPANPYLIGQCCTYEASEVAAGYAVIVELGWGDCPSGCISSNTSTFSVMPDGTIRLVERVGVADAPIPSGEGATAGVTLHLLAGPTCPVVRDPPDPACDARPIVNGEVVIRSPDGTELARATSNEAGEIALQLPPAAYYVEPQPVEGLMGTAAAIAFSVVGGETVDLNLDYDTGIR